jgi:hypothetical protein
MFQEMFGFLSKFFEIVAGLFTIIGLYFGMKNYRQILKNKETGLKYFIVASISISLSFWASSVSYHGFAVEDILFSFVFACFMSFLMYINILIRKKTAESIYRKLPSSPIWPSQYDYDEDEINHKDDSG